jgi:hypothetical protein
MEVWTFTANTGDSIVVRFGEAVTNSSLYPFLRIYGPNGALLDSITLPAAAEVSTRAPTAGRSRWWRPMPNSSPGGNGACGDPGTQHSAARRWWPRR